MKPYLRFTPFITEEHGELFADEMLEHVRSGGGAVEAFGRTNLIFWPGDENPEAVERYEAISDEIRDMTLGLIRRHIAETFVAVASVVLDRERDK